MKVWELIAELSKAQAGAEVVVAMAGTLNASIEEAFRNSDEEFLIQGGDAELVNGEGDAIGYLSEIAAGDCDD